MRRISASYIFTGTDKMLKNGILVLNDDNSVHSLVDTKGDIQEAENTEYYSGILCPGFINTHCHLELSHLKDQIPENLTLTGFIPTLIEKQKKIEQKNILSAIQKADKIMFANGISAVGDIYNTADTIDCKTNSDIYYHTFIEIFASSFSLAEKAFLKGTELERLFSKNRLSCSVVPHAPYSVSEILFEKIQKRFRLSRGIVSIHNQESPSEKELFHNLTGKIAEMNTLLGGSYQNWKVTNKSSLLSVMPYLMDAEKIILVHNIYTDKEDITFLRKSGKKVWLSLCPRANLYIENKLPDIKMFYDQGMNLCIGTDSYASNQRLSILSELQTITEYCPQIPLNEILKWGTIHGAEALNISDRFGSFEAGKRPGVVLIEKADLKNLKLTEATTCRRLV